MDGFLTVSIFMGLGRVALALGVVVGFLWLLDKWNKQPFTQAQAGMAASPLAVAVYRGLRWAGACLLAGLVIG